MAEGKTDNQTVEYDPTIHRGVLHFSGREIVITDAFQAKLHELPLEARKAIAKDTVAQIALMDFSRNVGGVIIEISNPAKAEKMEAGYKKGLKLLQLSPDDLKA